jgi:hypothetical protein
VHLLACIWIAIGFLDEDLDPIDRKSWLYNQDDRIPAFENHWAVYVLSIHMTMQTIVTVGYGDYTAKKSGEYLFVICLEFFGIALSSIIMTSVTVLWKKDLSFKNQLGEKIANRDIWVK